MTAGQSCPDGSSIFPTTPRECCNSSQKACSGFAWTWFVPKPRKRPRSPSWWRQRCATSLPVANPLNSPLMSDLKTSDLKTPDLQTYDPRQHLIVALDVSSAAAARKIVAAVGDSAL